MDLQRAKELFSGLADGVDPLTGEVLPEDHVCNKAEIIRAFHCVLKSLPGKASKPQPEMRASLGTMRTMQSSARCSMPEAAERKCVPTSNARRAA
jgi:hypothetical protein